MAKIIKMPQDTDPREVRLVVRAPLDTEPGKIDVHLGFGRGSGGRGRRAVRDTALYVATLRRLAMHLLKYAADYEAAHSTPGGKVGEMALTQQDRAALQGVRELLAHHRQDDTPGPDRTEHP